MFGRKKVEAEEIIRMLDDLTDDERKRVRSAIKDESDDGKSTEEQIDKAAENIARDGGDSKQTVKDRVDESVAAQERIDGNKDSQNAKDRVDESLGEQRERYDEGERRLSAVEEDIRSIREALAKYERSPREVDSKEADALNDIRRTFLSK